MLRFKLIFKPGISFIILLHEKFRQFDWLRAVVFQLNLKYLQVKITNLLCVVVQRNNSIICPWYLAYHLRYFKIVSIIYNNFKISLMLFMPNITTNHATLYCLYKSFISNCTFKTKVNITCSSWITSYSYPQYKFLPSVYHVCQNTS